MSGIVVVTNRKLCRGNFSDRVKRLADAGADRIILREKDMNLNDYTSLSEDIIDICKNYDTDVILHNFVKAADALNHRMIHLSQSKLASLNGYKIIGTSCHSMKEVDVAEKFGVSYITFGHVFETNCKKNLKPRGLATLREICRNTDLPVYAIGGMTPHHYEEILSAGAKGCCIMSSAMLTDDPGKLIREFKEIERRYELQR